MLQVDLLGGCALGGDMETNVGWWQTRPVPLAIMFKVSSSNTYCSPPIIHCQLFTPVPIASASWSSFTESRCIILYQ